MCDDSISRDDLSNADNMLQDFVLLRGILYGPMKCTMNAHLLQHFACYVSCRGPLWAYSCCFASESMNTFIKPPCMELTTQWSKSVAPLHFVFVCQNILDKGGVATDSKRLLRSLTGYSKHHYKTFSWVERGLLVWESKGQSQHRQQHTDLSYAQCNCQQMVRRP